MSLSSTPLGYLLSDDLIFTSRVTGTARDLGLQVIPARSADLLLGMIQRQQPSCIIIDLANQGLKLDDFMQRMREGCAPPPRVVAYGSHVDTATLRAAREAGCDPVLPRSKFVEDLPKELASWLSQ
jgi:CheY-like chemotaxis protein